MGDGGRTITYDPEMFKKTLETLVWPQYTDDIDGLDPERVVYHAESPLYPDSFTTFASDKDPRTQQFSQCYSHVSYSLCRVEEIMNWNELSAVADNVAKMASNYAATEDENKRDVFSVELPPKLRD
jgi:hypothetical protein